MINRKIKTAIVTGPTGAIGSSLCSLLANNGIHVFAVVHPGSSRIASIENRPEITKIECDLTELSHLKDLITEKVDLFYHLAWVGTTGISRDNAGMQISNVQYTIDAVHAAANLGCKLFIGAGSQAEYGNVNKPLTASTPCFPETDYGTAKLCAGIMSRLECKKLSMEHIWIRILSVYGPHDNKNSFISMLIDKLSDHKSISMTNGEQIWDYLYEDDAANALYLVALHGKNGSIYPLGSGLKEQLKDYTEVVKNIIDPDAIIGYGNVEYSKNQVMYLVADIFDIKRDTGFVPSVSFSEGIHKCIKSRQ
jgi:Nucleoside-diphosphate-sugar epimerases